MCGARQPVKGEMCMKKKTILLLLGLVLLLAVLAIPMLLTYRAPAQEAPAAAQETEGESAAPAELPAASAFAEDFFRTVGRFHPGTAGSSLGRAAAACGAYRFAAENRLADVNQALLAAALIEGRELLSEEEKGYFDENFESVCELIEECRSDWEAIRPLFDDAGVATEMETLLADPAAPASWAALCDALR